MKFSQAGTATHKQYNMLSEEDISQLIGNSETPILKTPRSVSDEFVEITSSPTPLYLSFDMEHAASLPSSPARNDDSLNHSRASSPQEDIQDITSFVTMLKFNSDKVKLEAASALLHVLSINHANTVVECGAVPVLLDALESSKQSVRDECVKCLSAIIGSSIQLRDHVIQMGGLSKLLWSVDYASGDVSLDTLLKAISAFFEHAIHPSLDLITPLFPRIIEMLSSDRESSVIVGSCEILSRLSNTCPQVIQSLIDLGTKKRLMQLMSHEDEAVVVSSLRTCRYLVPPRNAAVSRDLPISPTRVFASPKRLKYATMNDWKISPLMPHSEVRTDNIIELDVLVCQNVELFRSTEEDVHASKTAQRFGQVGLRCIHCEKSPFVRAEYSTVFPGSISSIAASIRHMASHHFPSCTNTPDYLRTKMIHLGAINTSTVGDQLQGLGTYCSTLCAHVGVQNKYPARSGLTLTTDEYGKKTPREPKAYCAETTFIKHRSLKKPLSQALLLSPNIKCENEMKNPFLSSIKKGSPVKSGERCVPPDQQLPDMNNFVPVQRGIWRCILCLSKLEETESGVWKGDEPPPPAYMKWHNWDCHRKNCDEKSNLRPRSITPTSLYQGLTCEPVVSNAEIFEDVPKASAELVQSSSTSNDCVEKSEHVLSKRGFFQEVSGQTDSVIFTGTGVLNQSEKCSSFDKEPYSQSREFSGQENTGQLAHFKPEAQTDSSSRNHKLDHSSLVREEDRDLLTPFTTFVMDQLEVCHVDDKNEKMANKFNAGFPGLRCKHCCGKRDARQFFWSCPDRYKNNSSELSKHLFKCKHCPNAIKEKLSALKSSHQTELRKIPRGGQLIFFRRMFNRLHGNCKPVLAPALPEFPSLPLLNFGPKETVSYRYSNSTLTKSDGFETTDSNKIGLGLVKDCNWLDIDECILRRNIEVFSYTTDDVDAIQSYSQNWPEYLFVDGNTKSTSIGPVSGQAGLRCLHCSKHLPCGGLSDPFASKMLTKVDQIRDACKFLQKHISTCPHVPQECKIACSRPLSNSLIKIVRKYYLEAAQNIGLYEDEQIVKFNLTKTVRDSSSKIKPKAALKVNPNASEESPKKRTVTPCFSGTKRNFEML